MGACLVLRVVLHCLNLVKYLLVVFLDEVGHCIYRCKLFLAYLDATCLAVGECGLHGKQMLIRFLGTLLVGLYLALQSWLGIVNVGLVCFPLLPTALILAHVLLCVVFQHCILAARELRHSIAKYILILFQHAVVHAVLHQFLAVHHTVGNGSLGL